MTDDGSFWILFCVPAPTPDWQIDDEPGESRYASWATSGVPLG